MPGAPKDHHMKIKEILSQHRRDFVAIYECEHCRAIEKRGGYDDAYFHRNVVPAMECAACGKKAPGDYHALPTKYPEGFQV